VSLPLFFVASCHIGPHQHRIAGQQFQSYYDLPPGLVDKRKTDQVETVEFGYKLLKQVLLFIKQPNRSPRILPGNNRATRHNNNYYFLCG
jgi:hypothetical protein